VYQRNRTTAKGLRFNAIFFGVSSQFFPKQIDTFVGEDSLPFCIINGMVVCVGNNAPRIIAIKQTYSSSSYLQIANLVKGPNSPPFTRRSGFPHNPPQMQSMPKPTHGRFRS
jgi:hypothetical protein